MLSDENIQDVTTNAVRARKLSWLGFKQDEQGEYRVPVLSPSDFQFARAIESAATAPLLAEIERLTRELEEARKDAGWKERAKQLLNVPVPDDAPTVSGSFRAAIKEQT